MDKYHVSSNGYFSICRATKNPCPLGAGGHFSSAHVKELKEVGDPRAESNFTAAPDSYYSKAKIEYERASKIQSMYQKIDEDVREYSIKLCRDAGINNPMSARSVKSAKDEALRRLKSIYIEEGVNPTKAYYLIEDIKKKANGDLSPIVRKKDKYDDGIEAKTERARKRALNDEEYISKIKEVQKGREIAEKVNEMYLSTDEYRRKKDKEALELNNLSNYSNRSYSYDRVRFASSALQTANNWKSAGVNDNAKTVETRKLKVSDLSIDKNGSINNAWADFGEGNVERIVSYTSPSAGVYEERSSGKLLTEFGREVYEYTHYHSYRRDVFGVHEVIVGPLDGTEFALKEKFKIVSSLDTGD